MFAKANHVVNLKGKKKLQTSVCVIDEKRFPNSLSFALDESSWPSSMLISRMTNLTKCTTRLCLLRGTFSVSTSNSVHQWAFDGIEIS